MRNRNFVSHRAVQAAAAVALTGLVAACSGGSPAPVELGGSPVEPNAMQPYPAFGTPPTQASAPAEPSAYPPYPTLGTPPVQASAAPAPLAAPLTSMNAPIAPRPSPPPMAMGTPPPPTTPPARSPSGLTVVVRSGQSVGGLAEQYHVSRRDIIDANHLPPPYGIEIGQRLVIPGTTGPAEVAAAGPSPSRRDAGMAGERGVSEVIPLDSPVTPARSASPQQPPQSAAADAPQRIDLSADAGAAPPVAERPQAAPARGDGNLLWPVQGRVLAGYGAAPGGRRNDGINIAARLGAPVRATDGGIVAYVGDTVPGYGNLVLIKHPDGFISAYAHCETLLVRKGEHVARGQVIAKVGATGGVAQPQLHFELRRGEQAVDPRQFLAPRPSAEGAIAGAG